MKLPMHPHARALVFIAWALAIGYALPAAADSMSPTGSCVVGSLGRCLFEFDWTDMRWAMTVAVVGGVGRTVFTLLSPRVVVYSVLRETWKDILISAGFGAVTYGLILGYNLIEPLPRIPTWTIVMVLFVVGASRTASLMWAEKAGTRITDGLIDGLIRRAGGRTDRYPGGQEPAGRFTQRNDDDR